MKFSKATKSLNALLLLMELDKNSDATQKGLSECVDLVPSMINVYVREFVDKGYIYKEGNNRNTVYSVSSKGKDFKNFLLTTYLNELMKLQQEFQDYLKANLASIFGKGCGSILLYGAGEVGIIYFDIIKNFNYTNVLGFIDDDINKIGREINNLPIFSIDDICRLDFDKVMISTFANARDIYMRLKQKISEDRIITLVDMASEVEYRFKEG
jgi:predicted transcriptional regulator